MGAIFLLNRSRWIGAARHHFWKWREVEQSIFRSMTPMATLDGVDLAGAYYRVARHFPTPRRQELVGLINDASIASNDPGQAFVDFVGLVRLLAKGFGDAVDARKLRPFSGFSKLLWYRFPFHGFIYDSQVLAAVCKNGLTVRYDAEIEALGGRPADDRDWNFLIAAAAYRAFALPLHEMIADVFRDHHLEPERAARLVDTLFWLEGNFKPTSEATDISNEHADAIGAEVFARCKSTIERIIGSR